MTQIDLAVPTATVVLNGDPPPIERARPLLQQARWIIAADGGANWLWRNGVTPHRLVGDLDSILPEALAFCQAAGAQIERYPAEKDETDAELALLQAVVLGAGRIIVLGALGGRVDHALANIQLLAMPQLAALPTLLFDGSAYLWLAQRETTIAGEPGDLVSLIPWSGDVQGVVTEELYYPLRDEPLYVGPARGISNVMLTDTARVHWRSGTLLIVHTLKRYLPPETHPRGIP